MSTDAIGKNAPAAGTLPGLPVNLPLRLWIVAEVLFGVMAVLSISLSPQDTATNFAWPIQATVTAALLGGFYVASAAIFVPALFVRRWENLRVFVPASILFTAVELLATFLHWDKFSVGTTPFYVWFASYLLPPPIFLTLYIWHQRRAAPIPQSSDEPLPTAIRSIMLVLGVALALFALAVLMAPSILIPIAPIAFTPLTARAFSGWVLAVGVMHLMAARENDRSRARMAAPFFLVLLPAITIELSRFAGEVDTTRLSFHAGAAVLVVTFAIGLFLALGDWRRTMR
jgi:hypothetical protein